MARYVAALAAGETHIRLAVVTVPCAGCIPHTNCLRPAIGGYRLKANHLSHCLSSFSLAYVVSLAHGADICQVQQTYFRVTYPTLVGLDKSDNLARPFLGGLSSLGLEPVAISADHIVLNRLPIHRLT